ncbi:hypothetical protein GUITHDRAFT_119168 [Guillardia theta CCMP2712]|uniref:Uncharacterized protein n=1 Tax=Guillardia theta (strain CCMP2712) TaxID=905079 RepID=L1IEV1_GUITC|nr:hypothetical protein GUITHDRAFT_119168 [Guillardia theta CCMP2712]EKX34622.1 hypothetical protein GUITHDRAFT_119168 [Guillardia theta CCMP2712]|eukprot:XP_005821602.1 hypothetical protein GUITHDRAFT_119168 [Guillardia theta CCMP2712]
MGEIPEALKSLDRAYQTQSEVLEESHPALIATMKNLGCVHISRGDGYRALYYLRKALKVELAMKGMQSEDVAVTIYNIGLAHFQNDNYERAIRRYEQSLDIRLNVLGERHPMVAMVVKSMGQAYFAQNENERALKYFQKALEIENGYFKESEMHLQPAVTKFYMAKILVK